MISIGIKTIGAYLAGCSPLFFSNHLISPNARYKVLEQLSSNDIFAERYILVSVPFNSFSVYTVGSLLCLHSKAIRSLYGPKSLVVSAVNTLTLDRSHSTGRGFN